MQQGHFAAHIRRMQLYHEQRDALAETLMHRAPDRLNVAVPDQGMHLVAYLRDGTSDIAIERQPNGPVSLCAQSPGFIAQHARAQASCWGSAGFRGS